MRRALPESQVVVEHGQEVGNVVLGYGPILLVLLPTLHKDFPQAATQPVIHDGQAELLPQSPELGCCCSTWGHVGFPQTSQLTAAKLAVACSWAASDSWTHFGPVRCPEQGSAPPERHLGQQALGSGDPHELGHSPMAERLCCGDPGSARIGKGGRGAPLTVPEKPRAPPGPCCRPSAAGSL